MWGELQEHDGDPDFCKEFNDAGGAYNFGNHRTSQKKPNPYYCDYLLDPDCTDEYEREGGSWAFASNEYTLGLVIFVPCFCICGCCAGCSRSCVESADDSKILLAKCDDAKILLAKWSLFASLKFLDTFFQWRFWMIITNGGSFGCREVREERQRSPYMIDCIYDPQDGDGYALSNALFAFALIGTLFMAVEWWSLFFKIYTGKPLHPSVQGISFGLVDFPCFVIEVSTNHAHPCRGGGAPRPSGCMRMFCTCAALQRHFQKTAESV